MGYDPREHIAYKVAKRSIEDRTQSVLVVPLVLENLSYLVPPPIPQENRYWDPESKSPQSTEFARSRFVIPFLQKKGWAVFMDCDIVCLDDIALLFQEADPKYAVQVVKHEQKIVDATKMDGQIQIGYPRKNWSSVVLWNCEHPAHFRLTKERLNFWPGRDLHAFKWLQDEEIGLLSAKWNQLIGEKPNISFEGILHYTLGGPWIPEWSTQEFDDIWIKESIRIYGRDIRKNFQASSA